MLLNAVIICIISSLLGIVVLFPDQVLLGHKESAIISPTAHYTGYVWTKNGLSNEKLATFKGLFLFTLLEPFMMLSKWLEGPTVEEFLLARHSLMDNRLQFYIESHNITQVIEIAAGLSPRGLVFSQRNEQILFVESDLSGMVELKTAFLGEGTFIPNRHEIKIVNALLPPSSPHSLHHAMQGFDRSKGTAVIMEGLVNYLSKEDLIHLWSMLSEELQVFPQAVYISDLHLSSQTQSHVHTAETFKWLLSQFVRGNVHLHFESEKEAEEALSSLGFSAVTLLKPSNWADTLPACSATGANAVRVIESSINIYDN